MSPNPHSEEHEAALCELLELQDPQKGLQESELADCPECKKQLSQLIQLRQGLDAAGAQQREGLAESAQMESGRPASHVREALSGVLAPTKQDRKPSRRAWGPWVALLSVAALVMLLFTFDSSSKPPVDPMTVMGTTCARGILFPRSPGDSRETFRWEPDVQADAIYQVHVHNAEGEQIEIGSSPKIKGTCEWTPLESKLDWNGVRSYFWIVDIYHDPLGDPADTYESESIEL